MSFVFRYSVIQEKSLCAFSLKLRILSRVNTVTIYFVYPVSILDYEFYERIDEAKDKTSPSEIVKHNKNCPKSRSLFLVSS